MPQRFLRPGIRNSPRWNSVSHEAHTLYIAILTLVDDYGRYDGRTPVLWAEAFAIWNDQNPTKVVSPQDTDSFCRELAVSKLVQFYEVSGRKYLQVTQWEERARYKSHWPEPPKEESCLNPAESCLNPASLVPRPSPSVLAIDQQQTESQLTEEQAIQQCNGPLGIPPDFARYVFGDWDSRDGRDGADIKVKWPSYVKKRWNREQDEWRQGIHKSQKKTKEPPQNCI